MSGDVKSIIGSAVRGLGYELVDFELTTRGLLRVFIDKTEGISVEDCAAVSNHLSRLFAVEGVDFERLEVSSPGLDRPLKSIEDFQRFMGRGAKIKLNATIDGRKRFEGVIESTRDGAIAFRLIEDLQKSGNVSSNGKKIGEKSSPVKKGQLKAEPGQTILISVPHENIDRARLIPEI